MRGAHIQDPVPQRKQQLDQLYAALKSAQAHRDWLDGHAKGNALAMKTQMRIIKQYKARIAELGGDSND